MFDKFSVMDSSLPSRTLQIDRNIPRTGSAFYITILNEIQDIDCEFEPEDFNKLHELADWIKANVPVKS